MKMKNIIIYFSSTGNSLFAAKTLSEQLDNCTLFKITDLNPSVAIGDANTNVGFIFPTYFFSIPKFFAGTIKKLNLNTQAYYYGITTCNGFSGNTGHQLKTILEQQGCRLSFFRVLNMPGNYIVEYSPSNEGVISKKIAISEKKLFDIKVNIIDRKQELVKKKFALISDIFRKFMYRNQHKWHKDFNINHKCVSCGLCKNICQFNNIEIYNGKPRWNSNCEHCVACIQLCPNQAIEYGNKTKQRERYKNPRVPYKDLTNSK